MLDTVLLRATLRTRLTVTKLMMPMTLLKPRVCVFLDWVAVHPVRGSRGVVKFDSEVFVCVCVCVCVYDFCALLVGYRDVILDCLFVFLKHVLKEEVLL